jgi:hypothetical protein
MYKEKEQDDNARLRRWLQNIPTSIAVTPAYVKHLYKQYSRRKREAMRNTEAMKGEKWNHTNDSGGLNQCKNGRHMESQHLGSKEDR